MKTDPTLIACLDQLVEFFQLTKRESGEHIIKETINEIHRLNREIEKATSVTEKE